MFKKQIQLSLLLENKPGRLAEICDILYKRGVDIQALTTTPIGETGILRMVVDDPDSAVAALSQHKFPFFVSEVLVAQVPNQPGMAAGLGHRFHEAGVNIEYTYFSSGEPGRLAFLVFKVDDVEASLELLARLPEAYN